MHIGIKNIPLLKATIPFIVGIYISDLVGIHSIPFLAFLIFILYYFITFNSLVPKYPRSKSIFYIISFFVLGLIHMHISNPRSDIKHFSQFNEANFLKLSILTIKDIDSKKRAICEVTHIGYKKDSVISTNGKLMTYLTKYSNKDLEPGNTIIAKNKYFEEKKNTNPHVFDYKKYLNYRSIYHRMHLDTIDYVILTTYEESNKIRATKARDKCRDALGLYVGNKNALAVAAAMVLGERNLLTNELYDAFTDTGAVHVLAVSGLHVGIVSWIVFLIMRLVVINNKFTRLLKLIICLSSIWLFAYITGAAAAVTRAAIMFTLFFLGKSLKKTTNPYNILAGAAFIMLLFDPNYLFQAGFQFSFLALTGIIFFYPHVQSIVLTKRRMPKKLWEMISVSVAAQVLVSPLAIYYFHKLPTYFWLTGIVAIPAAFLILGIGLLLLFTHFSFGASTPIPSFIGYCFEKILEWFNFSIFYIQKLPYCSADGLWLSTTSLVIIYLALIVLALYLKNRKPILLILFFSFLLLQSVVHNYEKWKIRSDKKLVVYDIYSESLTDIFYNGYLKSISPQINNEGQIAYATSNNRMAQRIISQSEEISFAEKNSFVAIDNKLFCFYPNENILNYRLSRPVDAMIISKESYSNIYKLSKHFDIKLIVLDGTLGKEKYKLKRAVEKLNIPIHVTSLDGALEYNI